MVMVEDMMVMMDNDGDGFGCKDGGGVGAVGH